MRFYNRTEEIALLEEITQTSKEYAQMTFMIGRRRIGKTSLLLHKFKEKEFLYFFVAKKSEALLCAEFVEEIKQKLNIPIYGKISNFKDLFELIMDISKTRSFTIVIDEFQEFHTINPSIYSEMQKIWDKNKDESKINLFLCGSNYSMMTKIFEDSKEPLFGRATKRIHLAAFDIPTLHEILKEHSGSYTAEDLFYFYLFTGGVAKYVEIFIHEKAYTLNKMLDVIF